MIVEAKCIALFIGGQGVEPLLAVSFPDHGDKCRMLEHCVSRSLLAESSLLGIAPLDLGIVPQEAEAMGRTPSEGMRGAAKALGRLAPSLRRDVLFLDDGADTLAGLSAVALFDSFTPAPIRTKAKGSPKRSVPPSCRQRKDDWTRPDWTGKGGRGGRRGRR